MENSKALCLRFSHHYGRDQSLIIVVAFGDGECVKIGWAILVPKTGTSVFCNGLALILGAVLAWILVL